MFNPINLRAGLLWRIGLAAFVLWAAPSFLLSQGVSLSSPPVPSTGRPFVGFDESLSNTADTLLGIATQVPLPATGKTVVAKISNSIAADQNEQAVQRSGDGGSSAGELRLNLLRPAVDSILRSRGVPTDLAAVILVESAGRSAALSPKGALGLWQLMPDTARRYGLRVDGIRDDRLDLFKATDAAARYLHDLYAQFGDWKLALAAYNTGEVNVSAAILKAHTQDFDQLTRLRMLPLETRIYVPRVLAAAQFLGQSTLGADRSPVSGTTIFAVSNP